MSEDRTLERLIGVLISPPVLKMNFSALTASIASSDIVFVHAALINGITTIDTSGVGMPSGAAAAYSQKPNLFRFPKTSYGGTSKERMDMLHEGVHAAADMKGNWLSLYFDWEVVAYICGAIYYRADTGGGPPTGWKNLFHVADTIGQTVMRNPGKAVDLTQAWNLRTLIQADPAYAGISSSQMSGNDGM